MSVGNALNINEAGIQSFDGISVFRGRTLTAGPGISISNGNGVSGNPVISNSGAMTDLHTARFIVSAGGVADGANFTSIASAITSAVAAGGKQTIFIQPGTYTEDLSLSANINLTAYSCDAESNTTTPNVDIIGTHTATFSGRACFSGICFTGSNGNFAFTVSGTNPTNLLFTSCTFIGTNSGSFRYTSNASPYLRLTNCTCLLTTNGLTFFSMTTGSTTDIFNSKILIAAGVTGSGSTFTDSTLNIYNSFSNMEFAILTSAGTSITTMSNSKMVVTNNPCFNFSNTSGSSVLTNSSFESGTGIALNINGVGAPVYVSHCAVSSSNANAISGGGEIRYAFLSFYGSSSTVNTATQTPLATLI